MFCVTSAKLKQSCESVSTSAITDHRISAAHLWTLSSVYPPEFPTQSCWAQTDSPETHHHYDVTVMMSPSPSSLSWSHDHVWLLKYLLCWFVCNEEVCDRVCRRCCPFSVLPLLWNNCFLTVCVWIELLLVFKDLWIKVSADLLLYQFFFDQSAFDHKTPA